jgi:transcriptional regulator with XRE-family HTH domain
MKTLKDYINEQMENEEFRNEYEKLQPEFEIIRAIVEARNSRHLTQKELSVLTGINQADISKIENGTRNPSLNMIKRLAEGMNMRLELNFIPKEKTKNIC